MRLCNASCNTLIVSPTGKLLRHVRVVHDGWVGSFSRSIAKDRVGSPDVANMFVDLRNCGMCFSHVVVSQVCRECDTVFPVGARLDSAVTSEELREKFNFEPEFNKDGTPMVRALPPLYVCTL